MNFEPWIPFSSSKDMLFKYSYSFSGSSNTLTEVRIFQYMPHKNSKGYYKLAKTRTIYKIVGRDAKKVIEFAVDFVDKLNNGIFPKGRDKKIKIK